MLNSKIPIRTVSSKSQATSGNKNEGKPTITKKKDNLLRNQQNAATNANQIAKEKENKRLLGKASDKTLQNKLSQERRNQESHHNIKAKSIKTIKENETGVKHLSRQVFRERNEKDSIKSDKWQPSRKVVDSVLDLNLKNGSSNPTNQIITVPQHHLNSVLSGRGQKKIVNPKATANHPSQPDIEFVPDENCRKRILSGKELSPGILQWPQRAQSSMNARFSLFNKPLLPPVDPHKAMLSIQNLKADGHQFRRSSVRRPDLASSPMCRPSDKFPSPPKTPNEILKIAMRRLTDMKLKDQTKSSKKVTFKLPDADWTSKVSWKDRKLEINELRLTDVSERSDLSSQQSTPELDVKLLPITSYVPDMYERRTTVSSFGDIKPRMFQHDGLQSIRNTDKKLPSILKTRNATYCNDRRDSTAVSSNCGSRKLRRSLSASELHNSPCFKSSALEAASSRLPGGIGESNPVGSSKASHPSTNICSLNTLRTSISDPELSNRLFKTKDDDLVNRASNMKGFNAADVDEKRMSRILASDFWSRKPRRSMSASELSHPSATSAAEDKSSIEISNRGKSDDKSSAQSPGIGQFKMLRTSISSPELSDRAFNAADGKLCKRLQNTANADKTPFSLSRSNNIKTVAFYERRISEILTSGFSSMKLRRSMSASDIDFPSSSKAQTVLNPPDASSKFPNKVFSGKHNQIESYASASPSPGECTLNTLRTSISSPELRAIFPSTVVGSRLVNNKPPNSLLHSQRKAAQSGPSNLLSNLIKGAEPRGSLYLSSTKNATYSSKLCTPRPVSFNPNSRVADSFSPEFLCRRTSNIISHAPIRTPLVMKNLAENDELDEEDDNHLSPARQKLDFETVQKEKEDSKRLSLAYLPTFKTQHILDLLADQECCIISSLSDSTCSFTRNLQNPVAKILEYGDEMHFVPLESP